MSPPFPLFSPGRPAVRQLLLLLSLQLQLSALGSYPCSRSRLLVTPLNGLLLHELPLLDEPFLLLASGDHPLAARATVRPAGQASPGLWLMQEGHCFRNQVLNLCGRTASTGAVAYKSGSIETLKELVRHHYGYTLVPKLAVLDEVDTTRSSSALWPQPRCAR